MGRKSVEKYVKKKCTLVKKHLAIPQNPFGGVTFKPSAHTVANEFSFLKSSGHYMFHQF